LFVRQAVADDAQLVLQILNSEIAAVDPAHGHFGIDIAKQIIDSPGDPSPTWLFSDDELSIPFGVCNLHPDLSAKELWPTLSVRAGDTRYPVLLDWFIDSANKEYPQFKLCIEINQKHEENLKHLASKEFAVARHYNSLRAKVLQNMNDPDLPEGVSIRIVDLNNEVDLKQWHMVYQNSFKDNFGFTPRDFDSWRKRTKADDCIPLDGVFLLHIESEPAGFIFTDDMDAFDSRGYITYLGVLKECRGRGYGQLLLATALARFSRRGYTKAELGVDTQNSTNALRVYEKMGFTKVSTWVLHERPVVIN
jgi:ribosomal protein S18 acetylase RimI-like enzyme